jgi:hypothetical protein
MTSFVVAESNHFCFFGISLNFVLVLFFTFFTNYLAKVFVRQSTADFRQRFEKERIVVKLRSNVANYTFAFNF